MRKKGSFYAAQFALLETLRSMSDLEPAGPVVELHLEQIIHADLRNVIHNVSEKNQGQ